MIETLVVRPVARSIEAELQAFNGRVEVPPWAASDRATTAEYSTYDLGESVKQSTLTRAFCQLPTRVTLPPCKSEQAAWFVQDG